MTDKEKLSFESVVWNRVAEVLEKRKIKQSWLIQQCKKIGMPITQPELSKLYNGRKRINVYELSAISKALGVSMGFFVFGEAEEPEEFFNTQNSPRLINNCNSEEFEAYLGDYFVYYNSTTEQEEKLQYGQLTISKALEGYCKAVLKIHTGVYRGQKEVIKTYEGHMVITASLSGAYLVIKNDIIGELCFMTFRHRAFTINKLECRIALCLTIGSGESKLPTAHRMLLCRKYLSGKQLDDARAYLSLCGNVIRIEKEKAVKLKDYLEDENDRTNIERLLNLLPEKQYYEVSVELLRRYLNLDREGFAVFIANVLKLAETEPYTKIYENVDNLAFSVIGNDYVKKYEEYHNMEPPETLYSVQIEE